MARSPRLLAPALVFLVLSGCSEELGPERPPTTKVRGVVRVGRRPIGGGWIQFGPNEGTVGNLRVAPIRPDGSFESDRVPVGRVVISLDHLPIEAIPTPSGPIGAQAFQAILRTSPIRRTLPGGRDVDLPIDLIDEAIRVQRSP